MIDYDELDDYDEGLALAEFEAPKRRRKRRRNPSNPEPIAIATPILLLIAGYLGWVVYAQTKTGHWTFTPWKTTPIARRLMRANPLRQNDPRAFDAAVEKMMAPAFSVIENSKWTAPKVKPSDEEIVGFIEP